MIRNIEVIINGTNIIGVLSNRALCPVIISKTVNSDDNMISTWGIYLIIFWISCNHAGNMFVMIVFNRYLQFCARRYLTIVYWNTSILNYSIDNPVSDLSSLSVIIYRVINLSLAKTHNINIFIYDLHTNLVYYSFE